MACNDNCPRLNMATASIYTYEGHPSWEVDYRECGMKRYGVYYHAPCRRVMWTWFDGLKHATKAEYRGEILYSSNGTRTANLYSPHGMLIFSKDYGPSECGAEPFDDLAKKFGEING